MLLRLPTGADGMSSKTRFKRANQRCFYLKAATRYFATSKFEISYAKRKAGANEIKKVLNAPSFNFDEFGWHQFYTIPELGQLDERYRDKVWKHQKRLKNALRKLVADGEVALPSVLNSNGNLHVLGAGLNTISKILAAHAPEQWPVYNTRVALVLADFGYKHPYGATTAGKYVAYRNMMQKFAEACAERGFANHREAIAAIDFFAVPSLTFGVLYCFFVIAHGRRQVLHFNVTRHPASAWVAQQLREAFPYDSAPRYLIFDRDATFNTEVVETAKTLGV